MGYTGGNHSGGFFPLAAAGAVPFGWVAPKPALGRSAPGAPPARRGSPFLPRNGEKEVRGPCPLDPRFYGPLAAARSFWGLCHIVPVVGLFRRPSSYPDLGTFFHKMLFQHIFPGNASQIGLRISEETAPRTDPGQQPPKRASGNERPLTQGGRGPSPATLCVRAFSRESLDPRPGPRGTPPRRCQPAPVQTRTTYQGQPGAAYPLGGCLRSRLGAQRPVARPAPGGSPAFFGRKPEERTPGLRPGPGFLWPLVPTRWVWGWLPLARSRFYFLRYTKTDLGRIFKKNMLESIFVKERFQIRG